MPRRFDAIVIGSGLGGLTAGALWARAGKRVLVLERNESLGGAATVYRQDGLSVEASLHEMDGLDDDDPKLPLLRSLGLDHDLTFIALGDMYEVRGGIVGAPFRLPHGSEAALAAVTARFPQHRAGLAEYFRRLLTLRAAVSLASRHQDDHRWWLTHAPEAARMIWRLLRDGRATVGEVMTELFGADEAVKLVLGANLAYYHDDPDRMLFLRYAIPQASYVMGGGHYIRGGSQSLTDALARLIRQAGGTLETGREAVSLLVEGRRVAGVRHDARGGGDQRLDQAATVFGNAAPNVLANMLGEEQRAAFLDAYSHHRPSISLWTVSLGLDRSARAFGVGSYSTLVVPDWMKSFSHMREAAAVMAEAAGERVPPYVFVDYGQIDSGLNETGPQLVTFCGIDRLENWSSLSAGETKARKEGWIDALIADVDRCFPGLAGAVVHREMATAQTMQRYLNTPGGAVYGFAPDGTLGQAMRQGPRTTIDGLWIASAYTSSGGYTGAMIGGSQAASQALHDEQRMR